ncbi:hypothetical protein D3C75_315520 [compost metagenome]
MRMQSCGHLAVAQQHVRRAASRQRLCTATVADVIDAFEQDHLVGIGHCDHVAIQPRQRAVAAAVVQQLVAADALVEHHEAVRAGLLQTLAQSFGPLVERATRGRRALGDGITQGHDHLRPIRALHQHGREHILLVTHAHAVGYRILLAVGHPHHGAAHRRAGGLREVRGHADLLQGGDLQWQRITQQHCTYRYVDGHASIDSDRQCCRLAILQAYPHVFHMQRRGAQLVADAQTQRIALAAQAHVLAHGLRGELYGRVGAAILAVRRGRGGPGGDPDRCGQRHGGGHGAADGQGKQGDPALHGLRSGQEK